MTTTAIPTKTPVAKLPLPLNTPTPWTIPNTTEYIEVTRTSTGFHVAVWCGIAPVDGWVADFTDEQTMRSEVRRAVRVIAHYGGTEQVRRRRDQIALDIQEQERRQLRRMHNAALLAELRAEDEVTEPIGVRDARLKFAADFAARYGQVAA